MAGTYYKYAEREADSYVNWAEIGKNMSDMLANENKVREEKKAAIDQSSREFGEILANAPQGESKLMNEWALKYAGDAQSARLMQDKLLKSGQLKLNDYLVMRQNVTDGTKSAFTLSQEYQEEFKTKWDRMKGDESADLEQFLMAEAEGFGNFNQTQLYINPTDGKVSVAYKEKGEDGVYRMTANPNKFTDINSLRNRIKGQFDKYDMPANMDNWVDALGQQIDSFVETKNGLFATGTIRETLDVMAKTNLPTDPVKLDELFRAAQNDKKAPFKGTKEQWVENQNNLRKAVMGFEEAETKSLQGLLTNQYNAASILTNTVDIDPTTGKPYTFTWDEADAKKNPEKILLKNKSDGSPTPQLSPEQEKVALERLRLEARMRYDKKSTLSTTPQISRNEESQWKHDAAEDKKKELDAAGAWNQLYTGRTAAEKQAAADILLGTPAAIAQGLLGIDLASEPGKVKLIYSDTKNNRTIPMLDANNKPISLEDFSAKGVELHKVTDRKRAMRAGGGGKGYGDLGTDKESWKDVKSVRSGAAGEQDYKDAVTAYTTANTKTSIETDAATKTAANLQGKYSGYGLTFEADEDTWGTTDNIRIKSDNGQVSAWFPVDDLTSEASINDFIIANYNKEKAASKHKAPR